MKTQNWVLILAHVSAFLGFVFITLYLWHIDPTERPSFAKFKDSLYSQISKTIPIEKEQIVHINVKESRPPKLIEAEAMIATARELYQYREFLIAIKKCSPLKWTANDPQEKKLLQEYQLACGKNQNISPGLWQAPPHLHPLGGSWAQHLISNYGMANDQKVDIFKHFLESDDNHLGLTDESLQSILQGDLIFLNSDKIFIRRINLADNDQFQVIDKNVFFKLADSWPYLFQDKFLATCLSYEPTGCWIEQADRFVGRMIFLKWVCFLIFVSSGLYLMWTLYRRSQFTQEMRQISSMAISHELRHPVTNLSLILNDWRKNYDSLPAQSQKTFSQFSSQVQRLKFLVTATDAFLKPKADGSIQWSVQKIASVNAWGKKIADDFNIDFQSCDVDRSFFTDSYWLRVAIDNLIKNALKHGKRPVTLKFFWEQDQLQIQVWDGGAGLNKSTALSDGLGMGFDLSQKIVYHMSGSEIKYSFPPCCFQFFVKEMSKS